MGPTFEGAASNAPPPPLFAGDRYKRLKKKMAGPGQSIPSCFHLIPISCANERFTSYLGLLSLKKHVI